MHLPTTLLAIGSTGLGKSTFGQLLCDVPTIVNSGTSSTACEATLYENNSFRYIDTPGFNDSRGATDEETFHQILRLLQEHSENGVFEIHKILWFCAENERKAANLQNEAKFIQRLVDYVEEVDSANLWKNVIIITKGNFPEEGLANGPKSAAYDEMRASMTKNNCTNVEEDEFIVEDEFIIEGGEHIVDHFPCWIFDLKPESKSKFTKMKPELRAHFNAYSKEEVVTALQRHIRNNTAIKIQFKEAYCTKCSEKGDPRLFISRCHPSRARKHEIETEKYHPKSADWQHEGKRIQRHWKPEDGEISGDKLVDSATVGAVSSTVGSIGAGAYALNVAAAAQPGIIFGGTAIAGTIALPIVAAVGLAAAGGYCIGEKLKENYKCSNCKKFYNERGCLEECDDCGKKWDDIGCISKYSCCNKCEGEDGCESRERCKNCNQTEYKLTTESGCIEYCQECNKTWGETKGCDPNVVHDIIFE